MAKLDELLQKAIESAGPPTHLSPVARWEELRRRILLLIAVTGPLPLVIAALLLLPGAGETAIVVGVILAVILLIDLPVSILVAQSLTEDRLRIILQLVEQVKPRAWSITGRITPYLSMLLDNTLVGTNGQHFICLCTRDAQVTSICIPMLIYVLKITGPILGLSALAIAVGMAYGDPIIVAIIVLVIVVLSIVAIAHAVRGRIEQRILCITDPLAPERKLIGQSLHMHKAMSVELSDIIKFINECRARCSHQRQMITL